MTIEILKLIASFLTPLIILILGLLLNKKIERTRIALLQEKEWRVSWAEAFLNRAIDYNKNISTLMTSLYRLQQMDQTPKERDTKQAEEELMRNIYQAIYNIQYLGWDIKNFAQFATDGKDVIDQQKKIEEAIINIFAKRQGDLEKIREIQFEYNTAVRKAHHQLLNANVK